MIPNEAILAWAILGLALVPAAAWGVERFKDYRNRPPPPRTHWIDYIGERGFVWIVAAVVVVPLDYLSSFAGPYGRQFGFWLAALIESVTGPL